MFNYGIAPGGGFAYQVPTNGYSSNQAQYYGQPQRLATTGWVQPQYSQMPSNGYLNYQTQGMSFSQPTNQGWMPVRSSGWIQPSYQQNYSHGGYHQHQSYNLPFIGGGCGNCGSSVPMIRRDW